MSKEENILPQEKPHETSTLAKILIPPKESLTKEPAEISPSTSKLTSLKLNDNQTENHSKEISKKQSEDIKSEPSIDDIRKELDSYKTRFGETKNAYLKSQRDYTKFRNESKKLIIEALNNPDNEFKTNEELISSIEQRLDSFKPVETEEIEQNPEAIKKNQFMQSFVSDVVAYNKFHPDKNILQGTEKVFDFLYDNFNQSEIDEIEQDLEIFHKKDPAKAIEHMEDIIQKINPIIEAGGLFHFVQKQEQENDKLKQKLEEKDTLLQQYKEKNKKLTSEVDETHIKVNNLEYDPTVPSSMRKQKGGESTLAKIIYGKM